METISSYKHSSDCKWIFVAPINHIIQVQFSTFSLEGYSDCPYDYVAFYNGWYNDEYADTKSIGKYCGTALPPLIQSSSNVLTMRFKSDDSSSSEGFTATYNFLDGRNRMSF